MPKKSHGLGRGLDVLLPEAEFTQGLSIQQIGIGEIDPNPAQPRRTFSDESIRQLSESIAQSGMIQPLLVTPGRNGRYRIVAGERRFRAARAAHLEQIPCIVREMDAVEQMEIALIENLQREDLNPVEAAQGIQSLMRQCSYTQENVAQRLGMSRPAVANALRLLTLPEDVIDLVRRQVLSAGHARVLCGLPTAEQQRELAQEAVRCSYSVRRLEEVAALRREQIAVPVKPRVRTITPEMRALETRMRETIGMRVSMTGTEKKGKIVLQYTTREELERLNDLIERLGE